MAMSALTPMLGAIDIDLFGVPLIDGSTGPLILWFAADVVCLVGLFWALRFTPRSEPDAAIMLITLNTVVFVVAYFMSALSIGIGFAFGLFALFGIMRYRTVTVSLRHMSYLFAAIALGVVNALGPKGLALIDVLLMDAMILASLRFAARWQKNLGGKTCSIEYDRVDLVAPTRRTELIADLVERTGLTVLSVDVRKISMVTELAILRVRFADVTDQTIDLDQFEVPAEDRLSGSLPDDDDW
jgi:hypothetical protein